VRLGQRRARPLSGCGLTPLTPRRGEHDEHEHRDDTQRQTVADALAIRRRRRTRRHGAVVRADALPTGPITLQGQAAPGTG
jgi:hypothetical protein